MGQFTESTAEGCANSMLVKVNPIGMLTETLKVVGMAHSARYTKVASHCSGETGAAIIANLAVATKCAQIKTGDLVTSGQFAKYNRLTWIDRILT